MSKVPRFTEQSPRVSIVAIADNCGGWHVTLTFRDGTAEPSVCLASLGVLTVDAPRRLGLGHTRLLVSEGPPADEPLRAIRFTPAGALRVVIEELLERHHKGINERCAELGIAVPRPRGDRGGKAGAAKRAPIPHSKAVP